MRSLRTLLLTTLLLATTTVSSFAGEITVNVNKTKVNFPDVKPYTKEGRTLVPIRFVADHLGAETSWNEEKQTATIKKDEKTIDLCLRCKKILVNGKEVKTEAIGEKKDDKRTMVPLRFLSENFGAKVDWNEKTLTVDITTTTETAISVTPPPTKPVQMKELSKDVLPKNLEKVLTEGKLYDGAGVDWNVRLGNTDKKGLVLDINEKNKAVIEFVILKDGTWIKATNTSPFASLFVGNYIGKNFDKVFLFNGRDSYLVDIPDIEVKEQWKDDANW